MNRESREISTQEQRARVIESLELTEPGVEKAGRQEEMPMGLIMREAELQERLLKEDEEYQRLAAEHESYDHQLEDLMHKHFLSAEEQLKEKNLKKKKLALKDQMYSIVQKARKHLETGSR